MAALPSLSFPKPYLLNLRRPDPFFFPSSSCPCTRESSKSPLDSARRLTTFSSPPPHPLSLRLRPPSCSSETVDLEPYLACSMPGKRLKVAVLLNGRFESSVALRLLHAAGHSCTGFYLKIWFPENFENFWWSCPWDEDIKYARADCDKVNVPLEVVHLKDKYWNDVVSPTLDEYRSGRTPNPDVLCNTRIKFGAFLKAVTVMGYNYVASGHYANVVHSASDQIDAPSVLVLSKAMFKDETYILSHLSQSQLRRILFPLGCMSEEEVRQLASLMKLPNIDRWASSGLHFLGHDLFWDFIAQHLGEMEGIMLEAETGEYLGNHRGFWFYTIGQRHRVQLGGGPWYVVEKDAQNNVIFVSRNYFSSDKRRRKFRIGSLKWFNGSPPENSDQLRCKVRQGPDFHNCSVTREHNEGNHEEVMVVHLSEDDQGLAAGQIAAFYRDVICIGSGVILEWWDDKNPSVCAKAREIAEMADKSKLGKPVRIKNLDTDTEEVDCDDMEIRSNSRMPGHI